ncbi:MAG: energy transducer TonB, partial [Roseivirga sp.]|nr:energy transducer TonB [Roseivirga sp.]
NNLKYPHEAYSEGIQGSVFLSFNVKHTGEIKNVRVIRGLGYGCDEEAVRVLLNSGKWNPGTRNGEDVNSSSNIRIVFTLKGKA